MPKKIPITVTRMSKPRKVDDVVVFDIFVVKSTLKRARIVGSESFSGYIIPNCLDK